MKRSIFGAVIGAIMVCAISFFGATGVLKFISVNFSEADASGAVQQARVEPDSAVANQPALEPVTLTSAANPEPNPDDIARAHRRVRPVPQPENATPQPYSITINVPACRLRLFENGKLVKAFPVCVGQPGYRSPVGRMSINRIMWNPSWAPPPEADWARGSSSKGPGKWNPVGLVKMPLRGYVFVHGTYKIKSLGFAMSHGCFRMANEDAVELAWFLQTHVGSNHPEQTLDFYKANRRTFLVSLNGSVPAETIYETIEVNDNKLLIHPDVYHRGTTSSERVIQKMAEAGWPTGTVDMGRIQRMIQRSKTETAIARKEEIVPKVP